MLGHDSGVPGMLAQPAPEFSAPHVVDQTHRAMQRGVTVIRQVVGMEQVDDVVGHTCLGTDRLDRLDRQGHWQDCIGMRDDHHRATGSKRRKKTGISAPGRYDLAGIHQRQACRHRPKITQNTLRRALPHHQVVFELAGQAMGNFEYIGHRLQCPRLSMDGIGMEPHEQAVATAVHTDMGKQKGVGVQPGDHLTQQGAAQSDIQLLPLAHGAFSAAHQGIEIFDAITDTQIKPIRGALSACALRPQPVTHTRLDIEGST
ncbi:hypothetical protein D3C77_495230 [compost metagenome]